MSAALLDAVGLLRLRAARGLLATSRRKNRAAHLRRQAESYAAVVASFEPRHPIARRARLLAASASFRAMAWDALAHDEIAIALMARCEANRHLMLARQEKGP